jgi:hypothetical protein
VVESNNEEERLSRIEQMIESLQRASSAQKRATRKIAATVAEIKVRLAPAEPREGTALTAKV